MSLIPVTVLVLPSRARADAALAGQLAAPDTLVVAHGDVFAQPPHALFVQVTEAPPAGRASLRPACLCCVPQRGLARTLGEAVWRFARGGRRQFAQALVVTAAADPASVLRVLLEDEGVVRHYVLARTVTMPGLAEPPRAPDDALLRRLASADVLLLADAESAARWQAWLPLAGLRPGTSAQPAQALGWPVAAPAASAALAARAHVS